MKIVTRAEAKRRGLKRYFTGKPCKRKHVSERQKGGQCIECARLADQCRDREKIRKRERSWYRKNAEKRRSYRRNMYWLNPDKFRLKELRYRNKNILKARTKARERYYHGPQNPAGERQWLRKNIALLRALKREIRQVNLSGSRLQSRNEASPT